jgi:uncharacterized protein YcbX
VANKSQATIKQLFLFPVKSLRGFTLDSAVLNSTGFTYDRHWMIVTDQGRFITQRQFPKMVLINTAIQGDYLELSKAGMESLLIPLEGKHLSTISFTANIWRDTCEVVDEGEEASQWLTEAIGTPKTIRLVRMLDNFNRPQSQPDLLGENTHTYFADAAPYLICNNKSLEAVNNALTYSGLKEVTIENFRPNIVLEGLEAFKEHEIAQIKHQDFTFKFCYPCERCIIPTIDINAGERHPLQQPFSLIAEINSMPDNNQAPAFGENAILKGGADKTLRVGDTLDIDFKNT